MSVFYFRELIVCERDIKILSLNSFRNKKTDMSLQRRSCTSQRQGKKLRSSVKKGQKHSQETAQNVWKKKKTEKKVNCTFSTSESQRKNLSRRSSLIFKHCLWLFFFRELIPFREQTESIISMGIQKIEVYFCINFKWNQIKTNRKKKQIRAWKLRFSSVTKNHKNVKPH